MTNRPLFKILVAVILPTVCLASDSNPPSIGKNRIGILDFVVDQNGDRVPGARVRAFHGHPTTKPGSLQLLAETRANYMGGFYIEADKRLLDFLLIDRLGACAILTRDHFHRSHHIILQRPCRRAEPH
jgi:hypothetical protein